MRKILSVWWPWRFVTVVRRWLTGVPCEGKIFPTEKIKMKANLIAGVKIWMEGSWIVKLLQAQHYRRYRNLIYEYLFDSQMERLFVSSVITYFAYLLAFVQSGMIMEVWSTNWYFHNALTLPFCLYFTSNMFLEA